MFICAEVERYCAMCQIYFATARKYKFWFVTKKLNLVRFRKNLRLFEDLACRLKRRKSNERHSRCRQRRGLRGRTRLPRWLNLPIASWKPTKFLFFKESLMFFKQHPTKESSLSYFVGCAGHAIGAAVDVVAGDEDWFIEQAAQANMRIAYVIDTHVHADHFSGGRNLAKRVGALLPARKRAIVHEVRLRALGRRSNA